MAENHSKVISIGPCALVLHRLQETPAAAARSYSCCSSIVVKLFSWILILNYTVSCTRPDITGILWDPGVVWFLISILYDFRSSGLPPWFPQDRTVMPSDHSTFYRDVEYCALPLLQKRREAICEQQFGQNGRSGALLQSPSNSVHVLLSLRRLLSKPAVDLGQRPRTLTVVQTLGS